LKDFNDKLLELKADTGDLDFINDLPEVVDASFYGDKYHVAVTETKRARDAVTGMLTEKEINITHLEEIPPSMEDVFMSLAGKEVV